MLRRTESITAAAQVARARRTVTARSRSGPGRRPELTSAPVVSIPRPPMRPAKLMLSFVEAGLIVALGALAACAKSPPEAHSAPAEAWAGAAVPVAAGA